MKTDCNHSVSCKSYFLCFFQVEYSQGHGLHGERDFLMSPSPGSQFIIKGLTVSPAVASSDGTGGRTVLSFGKKPFDWMSDTQWQMLLVGVP